MSQFSMEKLLDCLQDPKNFGSKYKQFKLAFADCQQHYIHPAYIILKEKLESDIEQPIYKMHVLRAIKQGVDTGSFGVLQFTQAQILPILSNYAVYDMENQDQDRGKTMFTGSSKDPSQQLQLGKIGNSFLRLVLQCIQVWATIKPYFISGIEQIETIASGYQILYKRLKQQGVIFPEKRSYYKLVDQEKFRQKYLLGLERLSQKPQQYSDYYSIKINKSLQSHQNYESCETQSIINIMLLPDYLIQQNTLQIIQRNIVGQCKPLQKILSLNLLRQIFHSGSIDVFDYFQNNTLPVLLKIIQSIDANNTSTRGGKLFPTDPRLGQKYYQQIINTIVILGQSSPQDPITGQQTQIKKAYTKLKNNGVQFPESKQLITSFKIQYQQNINNMHHINSFYKRKKPSTLQMNSSIKLNSLKISKRMKIPSYSYENDIHNTIKTIKKIYEELKIINPQENQSEIKEWLVEVQSYLTNYNKNLDQQLQQNIQLSDFQSVTNEAYILLETNINICKQINNTTNLQKKIMAIKKILSLKNWKGQLINQSEKTNSLKNILQSQIPVKSEKNISQFKLDSSSKRSPINQLIQKKQFQEKSMSSRERQQYQKQKIEEKRIISQYQKQHFDSRRHDQSQDSINFRQASSQFIKNRDIHSADQPNSIINNVLNQSITEKNPNNQSLISIISRPASMKQKNRIGAKLNDSISHSQKGMLDSQVDFKKQSLIFKKPDVPEEEIKYKMGSSGLNKQSIGRRAQQIIKSKQKQQQQQRPQGGDLMSIIASFGNVGYIPNNIKNQPILPSIPQLDFKKKDRIGGNIEDIPNQTNYKHIQNYELGQQNIQSSEIKPPRISNKQQEFSHSNDIKISQQAMFSPSKYRKLSFAPQQSSEIIQPTIQPMMDSFYQPQTQMKQQMNKVNSNAIPQFNDCFGAGGYLIPSKGFVGQAKKYWLQQDAKMLTTFNKSNYDGSIKSALLSNTGGFSIPQIIAEQNKHFEVQIDGLRDQHKKQISFLEAKIRKLEKHNKDQEKVLTEQKSQIQSLKGGHSEVNFGTTYKSQQQQYLQHQNQVLKNRLENKTRSHYQSRNLSPTQVINASDGFSRIKNSKIPKGDIFPSQPYQQFLISLNEAKFKKPMIKNKDLLIKNESIQVGFIVSKQKNCLRVAFFFQSQTKNLTDIKLSLNSKRLSLQCYPQIFPHQMIVGKQQRYVVIVYINESIKLPYQIPQLQMTFKIREKNQLGQIFFPIPITFNRLLEYTQIDSTKFQQIYRQNTQYILRGQQITYNKKMIKDVSSMKQILPKLQLTNPFDQALFHQNNGTLKFGVKACYEPLNYQFLIKINVLPGCLLFIQTIPIRKPSTNRVVQQFFISTLNHLLKKQRLW